MSNLIGSWDLYKSEYRTEKICKEELRKRWVQIIYAMANTDTRRSIELMTRPKNGQK